MMNNLLKVMGLTVSVCLVVVFSVIGTSAYTGNAVADTAPIEIIPDADVPNVDDMFRTTLQIHTRGTSSVQADDDALECLTKNIYFESGTESWAGKLAVGRVTLNRVGDSRFPDSVCGVVYDAKTDQAGNPRRNRCQFSWYCDGKSDKITESIRVSKNYQDSERAALVILLGQHDGLVEGATHYHATYVKPAWRHDLTYISRIDTHIFYRWE